MENYTIVITIIGVAVFFMAWMPDLSKKTGISYTVLYVLAGMALYTILPGKLPLPLPWKHEDLTLRLSEVIVIVSLMGTGIKIDRPFSFKNWSTPLRLVTLAMVGCIGLAALLGYSFLGLDIAGAVLLGAVLAPTDPVLASDVQVGPPNETVKSETRFSLTAEAGMNDGMAFPFVWLSIALAAGSTAGGVNLFNWLAMDLLYRIMAGVFVGLLLGRLIGYIVFVFAEKYSFIHTRDGFLALAMMLIVYGATELISGYGFIAVFVSAVTLRHYEKDHKYHKELHSFTDQVERFLIAIILILFGGALVSGVLAALTWKMAVFVIVFLLGVRPVVAYFSLYKTGLPRVEKLAISFLGIRGMGSVFYLAFAFHEFDYAGQKELWAIISFTILCSIFFHGLSASNIIHFVKRNTREERIPGA